MPKRSSTRITKRIVDALAPGTDVWDAEVRGFGVRSNAKGKTYVLKTVVKGRQRWITIGTHGSPWTPDLARNEAIKLLGQIAAGADPTQASFDERVTVAVLCKRYLDSYAAVKKKASSAKLDKANINNHVLPLIGDRLVGDVQTSDIEALKTAVRDGKTAPDDREAQRKAQGGGIVVRGGPGAANRVMTLLSTMMNLAELWCLRPKASNPVKGVARYAEKPNKRYLTADEFERLGSVLDRFERDGDEQPSAIAAIRLLIHTGARLGEILNVKWDQVQLDRSRLLLPDSKTGPKNIALPEPAVELLRSIPRMHGNPYVIVGGREGQHLVDLQRPWQRIRKAAGLDDVRIHDLRHSFASLAIQNGVSLSVIGSLLGHRSTETTKRYAHLADDYLQAESEKIGRLLSTALNGRPKSGHTEEV
jgi:integrase